MEKLNCDHGSIFLENKIVQKYDDLFKKMNILGTVLVSDKVFLQC